MKLVSVIIPTFNRYKSLLNAIKSIKEQTYKNIEIIVINDASTDDNYYNSRINGVIMINLPDQKLEFPCAGNVRNFGINVSSGYYICFLDDDDYFLPDKIELQVKYMEKYQNIKLCCTEALTGNGIRYNREHCWNLLKKKLNLDNDYPDVFNLNFIKRHNCIITSSVMLSKSIITKVGLMKLLPNGSEDYDYWLRILHHTNCIYIKKPLIYYDNHGSHKL